MVNVVGSEYKKVALIAIGNGFEELVELLNSHDVDITKWEEKSNNDKEIRINVEEVSTDNLKDIFKLFEIEPDTDIIIFYEI